jgi:hypothetical protein
VAQWLCENHIWISILLVVFSIAAFIGGIVLVFAAIVALSRGTDKVEELIVHKVGWQKVERAKAKASDLTGASVLGCIIVGFVLSLIFNPLETLKGLGILVLAICAFPVIFWLVNKIPDFTYEMKKKGEMIFGIFMGVLLILMAFIGCFQLYEWWVLKICGA